MSQKKGSSMDPLIKDLADKEFANHHRAMNASRERRDAAMDNIAEQTKLSHLLEQMRMGPREVESMRRLDVNKLAEQVVQQRAVRDQPQAGES